MDIKKLTQSTFAGLALTGALAPVNSEPPNAEQPRSKSTLTELHQAIPRTALIQPDIHIPLNEQGYGVGNEQLRILLGDKDTKLSNEILGYFNGHRSMPNRLRLLFEILSSMPTISSAKQEVFKKAIEKTERMDLQWVVNEGSRLKALLFETLADHSNLNFTQEITERANASTVYKPIED